MRGSIRSSKGTGGLVAGELSEDREKKEDAQEDTIALVQGQNK